MAEVEPKKYVLKAQEAPVEILDVKLHEDIRSDRDGRAHSHFSVSGVVKAAVEDFASITVGLKFRLHDGDQRLGEALVEDLGLQAEGETVRFGPLEGPVTSSGMRVSRIELEIEASVVTKSNRTVDLELSDI